jgi:Cu-Zn family superoxide dismutase
MTVRRSIAAGAALTLAATGGAVLAQTGSSDRVVMQQPASSVEAAAGPQVARAVMKDATGKKVGVVVFRNVGKLTQVVAVFRKNANVAGGFHGFHIHANNRPDAGSGCVADAGADPATWFVSADGHLADEGETHGSHVGDMPSVFTLANGKARLAFQIDKVPFSRLIGSAVMLHAGPDNFGNVPVGDAPDQYQANAAAASEKTAKTGNAGNRVACGVIKRA